MAFWPRREAKSHFRDSEAYDCDWSESIVFYHVKWTIRHFSATVIFAETVLAPTGDANFSLLKTHDGAVARETSRVPPGI